MTKPKKKGQRLATAYWSLVGAGSAMLLSMQPLFADTIWTRFSTIMKDVYGQLVTISTIVAVTAAAMVAMSSHYPFGTQIKINGVLYTVEGRGGSGIENDIHRVDIYVPDHNEALRLGRFKTTAQIYRLGR